MASLAWRAIINDMPNDLSRPVAAISDNEYSLSIDEAALRYEHAGHPRTPRSIQRYCAKGHIDCRRLETPFGEKFMITPESVARHIAYIEEVRQVATGRDMPRQVATENAEEEPSQILDRNALTGDDLSRPVATAPATDERYVAQLEKDNEFLRGEMAVKNKTIDALLERDRETNILVGQLQQMLAPWLGLPERRDDSRAIPHTEVAEQDSRGQ